MKNVKFLLLLVLLGGMVMLVSLVSSLEIVDNTDTEFNQGTFFNTILQGSGTKANITLNFTTNTGNMSGGHLQYNITGNFTSVERDTLFNPTQFDKILWTVKHYNTSDIRTFVGHSNRNGQNNGEVGAFLSNGSHIVDTSQNDFTSQIDFGDMFFSQGGFCNNQLSRDLVGFFIQDDAANIDFAFFRDGTYCQATAFLLLEQNLGSMTITKKYTIPQGFNTSNIIGMVTDTVNAIAFFNNGSFIFFPGSGDIKDMTSIQFESVASYNIPIGYKYENIIGVARLRVTTPNEIALFFNNGSYIVNTTNSVSTANITFTEPTTRLATYSPDVTIRGETNITMQTSVSNDSISWTPWSNLYYLVFPPLPEGNTIQDNVGRYIRYKSIFSTNDYYLSSVLVNVSVNYTQSININLNNPPNNNKTHNKTIVFNFTIDDPDSDKVNYTLWADINLTPNTNINQTLNVTEGNFIFNYTFGTEINGSINGTYYWKVNGTDNNSNNFQSSIFTFNITNNISSYNVTNISITPLPLDAGTAAKCHFNITNKIGQEDIISISDQRWWLNNTLVAEAGNKTLSAGNITLNSNITCEARINNGYGETAWTNYVNSSQVTVGDTTAPSLTSNYTEPISAVENSLFDIFANVTDVSSTIGSITAEVRLPTGTKTNLSMSLDAGVNQAGQITRWKYNDYTAGEVGTYQIMFHVNDGSGNNFVTANNENLTFTTTSAPSPSSPSTTPSGGGGGLPFIPSCLSDFTLISNQCVPISHLNVSLKIIGLSNIDQILFQTKCEGTEFRTLIKTNKIIKYASFEKPQPSFNVKVKDSDVLITRTIDLHNRFSQRIDAGKLRIVDETNFVAFASLGLRIINLCYYIPISPQKTEEPEGKELFLFIDKNKFIKGIKVIPIAVILIIISTIFYYTIKTKNLIILPPRLQK